MASPIARTGHVGINAEVLGLDVIDRSDGDGRRYAFLSDGAVPVLTAWEQAGRATGEAPTADGPTCGFF